MFDIHVQNGSISSAVRQRILSDMREQIPSVMEEDPQILDLKSEVVAMKIIANRRAEASRKQFIEDVRARKLCCATGVGRVHGVDYDIEQQFGITLNRINQDSIE